MIAILGSTSLIIYEIISHNLFRQFENNALKTATNAGLILDLVKHEHEEYFKPNDFNLTLKDLINRSEANINIANNNVYKNNPYFFGNQDISIQWLNEEKKVLVKEGNLIIQWEEFSPSKINKYYDYQNNLFSLILPIKNHKNDQLIGYIKIIESTGFLKNNLFWLKISLILGGGFALILTTGGAFLLTKQSLQPIIASFQELKQFTADASHELRTPLTVIKTSADLVLNNHEEISQDNLHKIKTIVSATEEMNILVNDLLLLARMDKEITEKEKFFIKLPLDEICEDLFDLLEVQAQSSQITLKCDLTPNLWIKGNASHVQRLLTNILSNALQYTPKKGKVIFTLKKELHWAIITVEDTGIGINSQELKNIFHRFWRGEGGRSHRKEGSGLGLAIAEKIAIHHGGKITVESVLSQGSTFRIYLPIIG
ncbi:sensor histidine kinase [Geminocystis herdmanii]|uniref:sensor histidine kinase n=1 Tax=Geminocystis herdmanii TaxID=669359 RepID=UPI00130ED9D4|nr:HAMP domain-containing sensor histidine kinase [Geminocystis herdmanii]